MPFEAAFYYCGDNVTSFGDLTTYDPERGYYGPSAVQKQEKRSFAPVLLSIELWTPHRYTGHSLSFTAHVVNDADDGADLPSSTLHWSLVPAAATHTTNVSRHRHGIGERLAALEGTAPMDAVQYYSTASKTVTLELAAAAAGDTDVQPGRYYLQTELRARDGQVIASNKKSVELFAQRPSTSSGERGGAATSSAEVSVLLYEPSGSRTATALQGVGVSVRRVDASGLKQVLQQHEGAANATTIVIGENSWDQALEALAQELRSYVDTGPAAGRIVLLQQSHASTNLSLGWAPGGAALRLYPTSQYIMHSGLTVGRGRPVHLTRTDHPVFSHPNALGRDHFLSWNDPWNWTESAVDTAIRPTPSQSPAALGVFFNSTNSTSEISANEAALNRVDVLLGHAMGLQNIVLADLAGRRGGGVLFCGLGIVDRAGDDPVADSLLENMLAYYANGQQPAMAPEFTSTSIARKSLHPMIESGHTVIWGNYSTERGLVRTDVNGLIVRPCSFDTTCRMNGLGNVPCGRIVTGPFTWTYAMIAPTSSTIQTKGSVLIPCLATC